ncbi:unnamed protein product, partial [Mesorhabditis belari]|uniref:Cyanocobalamin reductase (cyanide-eliminating) n=1 Tax=Mesorhabditis belari TaxID=2138241 RepID=A0AAF3FPC3_9BILA
MDFEEVRQKVQSLLPAEQGFEVYPFRIGAYNASVTKEFYLSYDSDSLGLLVLSTPNMFDVAFKEWISEQATKSETLESLTEDVKNPIADFLNHRLKTVEDQLNGQSYEVFHDHSMWPNRRPKIVMCTCGHVAGAAYYYQPKTFASEIWPSAQEMAPNCKFIGLSLHPIYGGHFAFRFAILFKEIKVPNDFVEPKPQMITLTDEEAREALDLFNYHWMDSRFRDVGSPEKRYSKLQMNYFGTPPADRWKIIKHWFNF